MEDGASIAAGWVDWNQQGGCESEERDAWGSIIRASIEYC